ncbi:AN1-type zinc finger protein 2A [Bienertia sinuspersici]
MSSMKLFNPSFSYGAKQSSFSKYEHQEHMSQSNYANYALPVYEGQAPDSVLGQPMDGFDTIESNHARGNNSNNYYAQAQRALPSPPVHVQQAGHQMGGMKKHEGYMGHEWASKSPKYSNPALVDDLGLDVDNENHMLGEVEYGWGNKPNRYSNPAQTHHFGESGYKGKEQRAYNYGEGGIEGGYASKNNAFSSPKYLSPIKTNQSSLINKGDPWLG